MSTMNPYNRIIHPVTGDEYSLNSEEGKNLLNIYTTMLQQVEEPNQSVEISTDSSANSKFKFHGRSFKNYDPQYVVYNGPFSGIPDLPKTLQKKISRVREALQDLGTDFSTAVIEKRPWRWARPSSVEEKGVALNYTFITECGKLMWRKTGVSHGTRNRIYTEKGSQYYTHWLQNPTLDL